MKITAEYIKILKNQVIPYLKKVQYEMERADTIPALPGEQKLIENMKKIWS